MTTQNIFDLSDTWTVGGTTYTAIKMDVTDTASAAASLLFDLQVGASSKFKVNKAGQILAADGTKTAPAYSWAGAPTLGVYFRAGRIFCLTNGTAERFNVDSSGTVSLGQQINFGSADYSTTGGNAILRSPSAAVFSLGNVDAASPVSQKLTVQGVVAGTTDTAGTDWTLAGSVGTGTGAGGSLIFQVAPAGDSGSAQNALANSLVINSAHLAAFTGPVKTLSTVVASLPAAATAGAGARAFVTDATATTFMSTVAGGGANAVPVVSDGTNWKIG